MDSNRVALAAIMTALLGAAFIGGVYLGEVRAPVAVQAANVLHADGDALSAPVGGEQVDFTPYWRVWNTLERKFIPFGTSTATSVPAVDRLYSSIEGLVSSYHDPYTVFMRPQVAQDFKIATRGSLEGIGAVIGDHNGDLLVIQPLPGSPAEKAGLVSGDTILAVDGTSTQGMAVDEAVDHIRGPGGTTVVLSIKNDGAKTPHDVSIVRGKIEIPSTSHAMVERDMPTVASASHTGSTTTSSAPVPTQRKDFYVLRLYNFSQTSVDAFERELKDFAQSGTNSLIIDLRGNPGGYLEAAVNIAGWFLPEGSVVVRERQGPERTEVVHRTSGHALFGDTLPKIAILVDKSTASAAEILSGALQEHGVATLVGTNTFGKGCVQELVDITDTLALKVTVARWYTPNGVSISEGGLTPDIRVDPSAATSSDPWIDAAVTYLAGQ